MVPRHKRPFDEYVSLVTHLPSTFLHQSVVADKDGATAREAFEAYDTHGKILPCREPKLLQAVFSEKEWLNLTIKMWCEDAIVGLVTIVEVKDWCRSLPSWMWKAFERQLTKMALEKIGFIPTFLRT